MKQWILVKALNKVVSTYNAWRMLTDQEIDQEYEWEYSKVKRRFDDPLPTLEDFQKAVKEGKPEVITPSKDRSIQNRSYPDDIEDLKDMVSQYQFPRDVDRIIDGLENNDPIPYPIVLEEAGDRWIMSGNTRMATSFLLDINPTVLIVKI